MEDDSVLRAENDEVAGAVDKDCRKERAADRRRDRIFLDRSRGCRRRGDRVLGLVETRGGRF